MVIPESYAPVQPFELGLKKPALAARLKTTPEDFHVTEIPGYPLAGSGDFLFLRIRRKEENTVDVAGRLARALGQLTETRMDVSSIGFAGLKDRNALTEQSFSIPDPSGTIEPEVNEALTLCPGLELLDINRHTNGLRRGHLKGNRFKICLRNVKPVRHGETEPLQDGQSELDYSGDPEQNPIQDDLVHSLADSIRHFQSTGMANLFGPQRFGRDGSTLKQGLAFMEGKKARKWLLDLGTSAVQSHVFNEYLRLRANAGLLFQFADGDIARRIETGGVFHVPVAEKEQERLEQAEICYTGPLFGKKLRRPSGRPLELEEAALSAADLGEPDFKRVRAMGDRRAGLMWPGEVNWSLEADSLLMEFTLPAGSYATVALSHFLKLSVDIAEV